MQSLFLSAVFFSLMLMGSAAAFVAALGFVWTDIVKPQQLSYSIINGAPLSMIAVLFTLIFFAAKDRKYPPKFGAILCLIALFSIWVTLTTAMSTLPTNAWGKWDWVIKVLVFALLFPCFFRSRVQIEAFILVFVFSMSTIFFSAGIKSLLGGGGYGTLAVLGGNSNTGMSESSTLALVCVALIPLIMFIVRHTMIFPRNLFTYVLFLIIILTSLATVVGTTARTGIIAVVVLCGMSMLKSKKKLWWFAGIAVAGIIFMNIDLSATPWGSRMSTIETYDQDSSALGRIKVWEWTLEFVSSNPLGGGFDAYLLNRIASVSGDGTINYYTGPEPHGKAFHSVYFEVLGEQGFPGFIIYFSMIVLSLLKLHAMKKRWRDVAEMAWLAALADALVTSIMIVLAGGNFVGIAYQPLIFYLIGLTVAIENHAARVEQNIQPRARKGA